MDYVKKFLNIEGVIGQGAFGKVLATSGCDFINNSDTKFALKCVHPILRPQRLANELRHLRDLGGQANIVQMHTAHFHMGSLFIVMEMIEHDRFVDIVAHLDLIEIKLYMKNLLEAIQHVHSHNIMHRDIKPANFLFNRKQRKFLLVDFGLAQRVRSRTMELNHQQQQHQQPPYHSTLNNQPDKNSFGTPKKVAHINAPQLMKPSSPFVNLKSTATNHIIHQSPARHYINLNPSVGSPNITLKRQLDESNQNPNDFNSMLKKLRVSAQDAKEPVRLTVGAYESPVTRDNSNTRFSTPKVPIKRPTMGAKCDCRGRPRTCANCSGRPESNAPRSGTPGYKAPEVLLRYPNQTTAVDIWSAGCIMACLLSGHAPFFRDVDDNMSLAEVITILGSHRVGVAAKAIGMRIIVEPKREPIDLKDLCNRIRNNPDKRQISLPDSLFQLLYRMLDPNPLTRITASEALMQPCFLEEDQIMTEVS